MSGQSEYPDEKYLLPPCQYGVWVAPARHIQMTKKNSNSVHLASANRVFLVCIHLAKVLVGLICAYFHPPSRDRDIGELRSACAPLSLKSPRPSSLRLPRSITSSSQRRRAALDLGVGNLQKFWPTFVPPAKIRHFIIARSVIFFQPLETSAS